MKKKLKKYQRLEKYQRLKIFKKSGEPNFPGMLYRIELRIEWEWSQVLKCPGKYLKMHLKFGEIKKKKFKKFLLRFFPKNVQIFC